MKRIYVSVPYMLCTTSCEDLVIREAGLLGCKLLDTLRREKG
jgi:hypothetical protein